MKMTIDNIDMLKLLPRFMRDDPTNIALAAVVDEYVSEIGKTAKNLSKWDKIDEMDDAMLNEIAWEFNVDWWDNNFDIAQKREVIKSCYKILSKRGTKWAVEELLRTIFGSGSIQEWFEYGGEPYMFKITTDEQLTRENILKFAYLIDKVKNTRSKLEGFDKEERKNREVKVTNGLCITKFIRVG